MSTHEHGHAHAHGEMTRNQSLVYGALCEAEGPLSAYTILDKLRQNGLRAPLQVYRALEKLVESGRVHRLESLNAFVACRRSDCATHASIAFTICEDCGLVREVADDGIEARLADLALNAGFTLRRSVVELRGLCAKCTVRQAVSG